MVGSLVLGAYDDQGVLRYVGNVGNPVRGTVTPYRLSASGRS